MVGTSRLSRCNLLRWERHLGRQQDTVLPSALAVPNRKLVRDVGFGIRFGHAAFEYLLSGLHSAQTGRWVVQQMMLGICLAFNLSKYLFAGSLF